MKIFLGTDHAGFELKQAIKKILDRLGFEYQDLGTNSAEPTDFPQFGRAVGQAVAAQPGSLGIVACRNGQGICIAANKVKGVRAGSAWSRELAASIRRHDDANVMCLAVDFVSKDQLESIVMSFIKTPFESIERRVRRIKQIEP